MTTHWIKFYVEFLDDPKVGRLPEWAQLRFMKFCLVAGEYGRAGLLPPVPDLAWRLRLTDSQVEETLSALSEVGVVATQPDGWRVVNFEKRQAVSEVAQRVRTHRARSEVLQRYSNVTLNLPESESDTESDTESEKREEAIFSRARNLLERITGLMSMPGDVPAIQEAVGLDIQEADIRGALEWRKNNSAAPARTIAQLMPGIKTERLKRVQGSNARPSPSNNGSKPMNALERARLRYAEADSGNK